MNNTEQLVPDHYETHTLREILTQPLAWQAALDVVAANQEAIQVLWKSKDYTDIVVTGCGSTHYLSQAVAPLLQRQLGIRARPVPASELLLFPETVIAPGSHPLLFTISRSGQTTETIRATRMFEQRYGGPVITIGCYPEAELVALSDLALVIPEGQEQSVVQTRSFSAMLLAAQAAIALAHNAHFQAMRNLPELGKRLIDAYHDLAKQLGSDAQFERFYFLGSGLQYGLASELNLKMKEMSLSVSEAFHFMEFRHGPMSMVNEHTLVVGLLSDTASAHELAVLREMRALGGRTLVLSEDHVPTEAADFQINFSSGLAENNRAVLYLPLLQLLGYYRARINGQHPDHPHNLTAVIVLDAER
ncbi:SIS domain-containing protein [Ktedonobacter racemifer]|uniref:Glutamine--fructose-6-phosphate transaminase (Isomerizing) n=1 Tax=Ktedonobacter racemifer DSM 44963 TaxID=485913 RepID=D6U2G0_KTERA|nr:SIS domain-containing protein [Ktedonobacter racemifer]EFH82828.1 Glutamine--fructose-6-phosphate transaminase (isomerizing) [Ktedonobacter racemifer DSM 44963]